MFEGKGIEYCRCSLVDDVRQEASSQFQVAINFIGTPAHAHTHAHKYAYTKH